MHIADAIKIKYDISPDAIFECIMRFFGLFLLLIETSKCAK